MAALTTMNLYLLGLSDSTQFYRLGNSSLKSPGVAKPYRFCSVMH